MSDGRFAILDPAAGISGDMVLGALIAAGASPELLRGLPRRLGCPDVEVEIATVTRAGVQATKVDVILPGGRRERPAAVVPGAAPHDHVHRGHTSHGHADHDQAESHQSHTHDDNAAPASLQVAAHAPHRHIGELIGLIEGAPLSTWVRERAVAAFQLLGEAEGRVHGVLAEQVALHEVGALDALIDIVGSIEGFEQLGVSQIYNRPVPIGSGWVRAAHGTIPVPAPATAILLEGLEVGPNGPVTGEATTPTGAVLLRVLSSGPPPTRWRALGAGAWGAGARDPKEYPNALRLILAEPAAEASEVVVLSTDVDDLNPEYLEPLREALFAEGALDVQLWASQMKKGRPGFRLEVVAAQADAERVTSAIFRHSTTAGVRRHTAERVTLARRELRVSAGDGTTARVKVFETPDGVRVKPEYDDVAAVARRTGRPAHEVARDLHSRALRLVSSEGAARPLTPNKES